MLNDGGSYVFQFSSKPDLTADDSIANSLSGSQVYTPEKMMALLRAAGFDQVEMTKPIDLKPLGLDTETVWYLCKAAKRVAAEINVKTVKVRLGDCALNLGELHRLKDFGYFNPVFHCVTEDGDEFVARMRLHLTEPLEKLIIVDPRTFSDGGYAANSAGSKILKRKSGYVDTDPGKNPVLNPVLLDGRLYLRYHDTLFCYDVKQR